MLVDFRSTRREDATLGAHATPQFYSSDSSPRATVDFTTLLPFLLARGYQENSILCKYAFLLVFSLPRDMQRR